MALQRWMWTLALGFSPLVVVPEDTPDVSGTWVARLDSQTGKREYVFTFQVRGSQLTGQVSSAQGTTRIREGKVEDREVTFVEDVIAQGVPLRIVYTGMIATADQIDFTRNVACVTRQTFSARRTGVPRSG